LASIAVEHHRLHSLGDEFFRTRKGRRFFEATMPKIADHLERLNANLEALVAELRKRGETPPSTDSKQQPAESKWTASARKR
jgi:hypothetical protein